LIYFIEFLNSLNKSNFFNEKYSIKIIYHTECLKVKIIILSFKNKFPDIIKLISCFYAIALIDKMNFLNKIFWNVLLTKIF
jgi:hypothetical protein